MAASIDLGSRRPSPWPGRETRTSVATRNGITRAGFRETVLPSMDRIRKEGLSLFVGPEGGFDAEEGGGGQGRRRGCGKPGAAHPPRRDGRLGYGRRGHVRGRRVGRLESDTLITPLIPVLNTGQALSLSKDVTGEVAQIPSRASSTLWAAS